MSNTRSGARTTVRRIRVSAAAIGALALFTAGCANDPQTKSAPIDLGGVKLVAALSPFDRCDDLLDHLKQEALDRVGPYGLNGGMMIGGFGGPIAMEDAFGMPATASGRSAEGPATTMSGVDATSTDSAKSVAESNVGGAPTPGSTGTNNQEAGVDEADLVKTDGTRIVTVRGNKLESVTLTNGAPYRTATVDLGAMYADRLFLLQDRVYVIGTANGAPIPIEGGGIGGPAETRSSSTTASSMAMPTGAMIIEVTLNGEPNVVGSTTIDGQITDGRMADGTVRLVVSSMEPARLGFVYPEGPDGESRAEATNRKVIEESKLEDWMPGRTDAAGTTTPLLQCDQTYEPAEFSGFSTLSVLTIADGLGSLVATGVLADGGITYASDSHLYVATNQWQDQTTVPKSNEKMAAPSEHTDLHSFAIDGDAPATYLASGRVDGHALNQYSMSEAEGRLRIATTVSTQFNAMPTPQECPANADCAAPEIAAPTVGDNRVVVLEQDGKALEEVGSVGGLGKGEQIMSVRFVGNTAYVVTFKQTDPFYVVDLSNPAAPKVTGELKLPGFSSYLHPISDTLTLGVGSDATEEGRITGAKLTIFDTSNPAAPKEVNSWTSKDLGFMVDGDPHAFSWDAEHSTAYLPYYGTCFSDLGDCITTNGVLVVRVTSEGITEIGRINHSNRTPSPPITTPETTTTVPETTVPETTSTTVVPETTIPATTVPETTVPETTVPETTIPGTTDAARSAGSSAASSPTSPPVSPPTVICDPAACDPFPGPFPEPVPPVDYLPTISRVFVIGDRVITLSDVGIAAHDIANLNFVGFAAF